MVRTARMSQIEALLADDPNDPFLRYGLAMEYVSGGDDGEAVRHLKELIELTDSTAEPYIPAYLQAGQALTRMGNEKEAAKVLKQGILRAKQVGDAHAENEMSGLLSTIS